MPTGPEYLPPAELWCVVYRPIRGGSDTAYPARKFIENRTILERELFRMASAARLQVSDYDLLLRVYKLDVEYRWIEFHYLLNESLFPDPDGPLNFPENT